MFSFFEKFQSKDVEEEENPSWLYPLLYTLLAIFIAVFSAFIGFRMSRKSSFQPRVILSGQNIYSLNVPKGRKRFIEYFTKKKNVSPTADYYQANTGKWIQQPIGRALTQENLNERNESFGGKKKRNYIKKR
jgi:hypothetical protein